MVYILHIIRIKLLKKYSPRPLLLKSKQRAWSHSASYCKILKSWNYKKIKLADILTKITSCFCQEEWHEQSDWDHYDIRYMIGYISLNLKVSSVDWNDTRLKLHGVRLLNKPSDVQVGGLAPQWGFLIFFLDDETSAPDVFSSCSFIPRPHYKTSLVMVSYYGYAIWCHK